MNYQMNYYQLLNNDNNELIHQLVNLFLFKSTRRGQ